MEMPISARAAEDDAAAEPTPRAEPAPPPTVQDVLHAIERLGTDFYAQSTPMERIQVRRATCPSDAAIERAVHTNPHSSLLTTSLVALAIGVLVGTMLAPNDRYRGAADSISATSKRAVDRMLRYA